MFYSSFQQNNYILSLPTIPEFNTLMTVAEFTATINLILWVCNFTCLPDTFYCLFQDLLL